jgi:regulator of cell morphogenesis and NO signaling
MTDLRLDYPVGQLVAKYPRLARVFERIGIDYCCGGRATLVEACRAKGLEVAEVLDQLAVEETETRHDERGEFDGASASMVELIDHIVTTHHAYLRRELPRLAGLAGQVVAAHRNRHSELHQLRDVFDKLRVELTSHMLKEEKILFPIIARLESATEAPQFQRASVINPIRVMEHEHDDAGTAVSRLRALTGGFRPPADACPTYRALLDGLAELEADLHVHIHQENNILFPRARAAVDLLQPAKVESGSR